MSERTASSSLPAPLRHALVRVARKHLLTRLSAGLAWLVIAGLLLLTGQMLLDRLLDFPRPVRAVLLGLDAGVLGWVGWRQVIRPWRRRWRAPEAAFAIQRHWPALGSRLISAVELAPSADAPRAGSSPLLVRALLQEASDCVASLPLGQVVRAIPAIRRVAAAVLLAGALAGLACGQRPLASVLLRRAVLVEVPLPTATVVVPETRDLRAALGTRVVLAARAEGVLPAQGRLELALAGGERRTLLVRPDADQPARFSFTFENVQQPFTYRFYLGDGRGPAFKVEARPAPLLEQAEFLQEFPAYTGRPPLRQPAGALTFFPGSRVRVVASSSQPLGQAELQFTGETAPGPVRLAVDTDASLVAKGEFTVPAAGLNGLSLPLVSAGGIAALDNTVYPVRLEADRPPGVKIEAPVAPAETLVPSARLAVRARVRDDFAVARVEFVWEIPGGPRRRRALEPAADGLVSFDFVPSAETPPLAEGTQLTWWLEATDNNTVTGPGVGSSERRQLGIVSFARKQQEMLERLEDTSRRMEDIARRQGEVRETLGKALRRDSPAP